MPYVNAPSDGHEAKTTSTLCFHAINSVIGDRLGLYRSLLASMPATPAEVAEEAGVVERSVREWLKGQAAGGYVA